jgi:RNA polymerase sigma-70 factor (ECF subfamily)
MSSMADDDTHDPTHEPTHDDDRELVRHGDENAFGALTERHRAELRVHCYRLLGSLTDAEDLVQETMLRAWRGRATYAGRASARAWLYRIATNACLDFLRRHPERVVPVGDGTSPPPSELPWLQPFPDSLLDGTDSDQTQPEVLAVTRETIELAYLALIQLLPPNQRAVLVLRDVLGWSAAETADLLDTSVASVTSALQRARDSLGRRRSDDEAALSPSRPSAAERALLSRYMDAHARADAAALSSMLKEDVRFTMPPQPHHFVGRTAVGGFIGDSLRTAGTFLLVETSANRSPAAANYLREPGDDTFRALSLDVLRVVDGEVAEITTFEPELFGFFGLPQIWVPGDR